MKNQQNNTSALPALLRTPASVDTLETNSLCCAAAGIIASPSANTEALIPHEKLRGAALADATLNAQARPLAQPVVGYKQFPLLTDELHTGQQLRSNADLLGAVSEYGRAPQTVHLRLREEPGHNRGFLQSTTDGHKRFHHIWQREINRINYPHGHQMFFGLSEDLNSLCDIRLMQRFKISEQHVTDFRSSRGNTADKPKYNLVSLPASMGSVSRLFVTYIESRAYSCDSSESLNPCSSTFIRPACEKQRNRNPKTKGSRRREDYFVNRTGVELDLSGPHKWLPATTQKRSLITSATVVHEDKKPAHHFFIHGCTSLFSMLNNGRGGAV